MDKHVKNEHEPNENEEVIYTCKKCQHDFTDEDGFRCHMKSHKQTDVGTENISPSVRMSSSGKEDLQEVENLIYCQLLEFFIHDETVENMKEQSPKC